MVGNAMALSPGVKHQTPVEPGARLTHIGYRPSGPGSDVIELPWFRSADGTEGFLSRNGPWGTLDPDVLRIVEVLS
jgi:hypothetical protein